MNRKMATRMPNKKSRRSYPVEWQESAWERELWRAEQTFKPVLALIEETAQTHGRQKHMDEIVLCDGAVHVPFTIDRNGVVNLGRPETAERRAVVLTHTIHRSVRNLVREEGARIIRQTDVAGADGSIRRVITIRWDRQFLPVAEQIKALQDAVQSGSSFRIERAWFGLTPRAHEYLSVGFAVARHRGKLANMTGEIFDILLEVSGRRGVGARRGDAQEPAGPGAVLC
jgi:hypothetical protein